MATGRGSSFSGIRGQVGSTIGSMFGPIFQNTRVADVRAYGAKGDGVTDDTAAVAAAVAANRTVDFGGSELVYRITAAITLPSNRVLRGNGATIRQVTANTQVFNATGSSDVEVCGLRFQGKGDDYADSDNSLAVAIYCGTSGSRIHVHDCHFEDFTYTSVRFKANTDIRFEGNTVVGPGSPELSFLDGRCYGVLLDSGCSQARVVGNDISDVAQGVRAQDTSDLVIADNIIHDVVGQHGLYIGEALDNVAIIGNAISDVALIGIKVQASDAPAEDFENVTISGNTVLRAGSNGISVEHSGGVSGGTQFFRNVAVVGNVLRDIDQDGIYVNSIQGGVVANNVLSTIAREGISIANLRDVQVLHNSMRLIGKNGLRDRSGSLRVHIVGNQITNPGQDNAASNNFGIWLESATNEHFEVRDNVVYCDNGFMEYGFIMTAGVQTSFRVTGNRVTGANTTGARFKSPAEGLAAYFGNNWNGTLAEVTNDPTGTSICAATIGELVADAGVTVDGALVKDGSFRQAVVSPSATGSVAESTGFEAATAGADGITRTLPTPVGKAGKKVTIKKVDAAAGAVTVATAAGTIDGAATYTLELQYEAVTVVSDGTKWQVIA